MTWNVMSPLYIRTDEYVHLNEDEKKNLEWNIRLVRIIELIEDENPDVLLLQEITIETFHDDFEILFENYVHVVHQQTKRRDSPIGNVVFIRRKWNATILDFKFKTHALHVKLEHNEFGILFIANVHFSAGLKRKETDRLKEALSCLSVWSREELKNGVSIVAGDFNDDFNNAVGIKSVFLKAGFDNFCNKDKMTCIVKNLPFNFDHFLVKGLSCVETTPTIDILRFPTPNVVFPSDHVPLVVMLQKNLF